ncbi:hypothetical protein ACE6H2_014543 [Prunus campanulata]
MVEAPGTLPILYVSGVCNICICKHFFVDLPLSDGGKGKNRLCIDLFLLH